MLTEILSDFQYPFPTLKNPFAEIMQRVTDEEWIDGEYLWIYQHDPVTRQQYKRTRTAHMISQWFPTAGMDQLKPLCRFMLWTLYNDDTCEEGTPDEIRLIHERSIAVLNGDVQAVDAGIPLGGLLASLRQELMQFIAPTTYQRFLKALTCYFTGLEQELQYKFRKIYPSFEECIAVRENSLCLFPFLELTEVETGITLPPEIHEQEVLQNLRRIASRLLVYFNDVQSVMKDEATNSVYYNVVKVIQHHQQISLKEACLKVLLIHNEELKKFVALQSSLSGFGEWQEAIVNYAHYISMKLSGWKSVSSKLERYNSIAGFPEPQAVKQTIFNK